MSNVTIKYGDDLFYAEGDYDEVCKAIVDGKPVVVRRRGRKRPPQWITFFGDPDWVAVEL
jgi:hypothetical protein